MICRAKAIRPTRDIHLPRQVKYAIVSQNNADISSVTHISCPHLGLYPMEKKKRSLINVFMASMLAMISLPVILLSGMVLFRDYYFFRQEKDAIRHAYVSEQEAIFKHQVEKSIDYIQWTRKQKDIPEEELKAKRNRYFSYSERHK